MVSSKVHSYDVYRLFLQATMSRRILSEPVAKAVWKACYDAVERAAPTKKLNFEDSNSEWDAFLDKIKRLLDPVDLEIARFKDEDTGNVMYAITNTKGDEVAQLASDYNPTEITFFKAVVEQIMLTPRYGYSVSSILALQEVGHLKGTSMTKTQGEVILASLVARGWLVKSKRGRYSLGTRTILELSNYLKNTYDETDLLECVACMELVTKGYMCPTANCNAPLHKHCYEAIRRRNICPKCQREWGEDHTGLIPIGEDAISEKDAKKEKRRRRRNNDVEEEEGEEESQEPSQTQTQSQTQPSQTQTQSRTQTRKGKSKKATTKANGKNKRRASTPDTVEEEDQLDDMYDDDPSKDDDAIDIDNLNEIREKPSGRIHRRT